MQQSLPYGTRAVATPSFSLISRQPLGPGAILIAIVMVVASLWLIVYATGHARNARRHAGDSEVSRSGGPASGASAHEDEDDPNQVDTIVLGDPADAPVPGRRGDHVSPVHPTILVRLPRYGDQVGLIPGTPAGQLLYNWLAAFNQASEAGLGQAVPSVAPESATAAQMELRKQTGGFNLLSAKEVQPGVLVFRLRDQTPAATEVLGTLQVRANSSPAAIASFSLRAVPSAHKSSMAEPAEATRP